MVHNQIQQVQQRISNVNQLLSNCVSPKKARVKN